MTMSDPTFPIRRSMLVGIALLSVNIAAMTAAMATPQGVATLDGYACAQVDPELFPRQNWSERGDPYGIPFIEWDRTTFEALKRRMTACATDANRRRTVMMLRYIDDQPYGRQMQVTGQVETLRAKQAVAVDREAELREAVRAAEADPDLSSRRNRIAAINQRLARGGIPSALELDMRARLDPLRSAIAQQDEKNAAANAAAQARQLADDAKRADEQRKLAEQQEAIRQADMKNQQAAAEMQASAQMVEIERVYAQKAPNLPAPVRSFLEKNPPLKAPDARNGLAFLSMVLDAASLTLETCRSTFDGYQSEWAEVQRRYGLLQQVLITYHAVSTDQLAADAKNRRQIWKNNGETGLQGNSAIVMRRNCNQAVADTDALADFSR